MNKKTIGVYCLDENYSQKLVDYIIRNFEFDMKIMAFHSNEEMKEYGKENDIYLLLVDAGEFKEEEFVDCIISKIVLLSDSLQIHVKEGMPVVFKYQRADLLIKQVMEILVSDDQVKKIPVSVNKTGEIYGIFSFTNTKFKEALQNAICSHYGRTKNTIYINLEEFPCSYYHMNFGQNVGEGISDLLYYLRMDEEGAAYKIQNMISKREDYDAFLPVAHYSDLNDISNDDMKRLVTFLFSQTTYQSVVLDFGQLSEMTFSTFSLCDKVFIPVEQNNNDYIKYKILETIMKDKENGKDLLEKMIQVPLSAIQSSEKNQVEKLLCHCIEKGNHHEFVS